MNNRAVVKVQNLEFEKCVKEERKNEENSIRLMNLSVVIFFALRFNS